MLLEWGAPRVVISLSPFLEFWSSSREEAELYEDGCHGRGCGVGMVETATATGGDRRSAGANTGPGGRAGAAAGERDEQEGELCTRERYDIAVFESCMPDYMGSSGYCVLASSTQMKRPGSSESGSICNNGLSYRCTYPFLSWALLFPKDEMCTIQLGKAVRMCKVQWFGGPGYGMLLGRLSHSCFNQRSL